MSPNQTIDHVVEDDVRRVFKPVDAGEAPGLDDITSHLEIQLQ